MDTFFELVKKRRSIRRFNVEKIEKSILNQIMQAGLMAPTSKNTRACEFVLVENSETLLCLSKSRISGSSFIENAAAAIVVCVNTEKSTCIIEDTSIAAITMQFAAEDFNLGSCWVQINRREKENGQSSEEYIKKLLQIPNHYAVECIIALGVKLEEKPEHDEQSLDLGKIHLEKFKSTNNE